MIIAWAHSIPILLPLLVGKANKQKITIPNHFLGGHVLSSIGVYPTINFYFWVYQIIFPFIPTTFLNIMGKALNLLVDHHLPTILVPNTIKNNISYETFLHYFGLTQSTPHFPWNSHGMIHLWCGVTHNRLAWHQVPCKSGQGTTGRAAPCSGKAKKTNKLTLDLFWPMQKYIR